MRGNRRLVVLLVAIAVATVALALPAASLAGSPKVGPLAVKEIDSETSTAEAMVRPEGPQTEYEFWLDGPRKGPFCESSSPCEPPAELLKWGYVEAGVPEEPVSVRMTDLKPSSWYTLYLVARNTGGAVEAQPSLFETGLPSPVLTGNPYEREDAGGASWAEQSSRQAVEAVERERREANERAAREASERQPAVLPPAPQCEVPRLKGDTLRTAQAALRKAHCQLGRVRHPKHSHGRLVISRQSPAADAKLDENASVAVILGARPTKKTRH